MKFSTFPYIYFLQWILNSILKMNFCLTLITLGNVKSDIYSSTCGLIKHCKRYLRWNFQRDCKKNYKNLFRHNFFGEYFVRMCQLVNQVSSINKSKLTKSKSVIFQTLFFFSRTVTEVKIRPVSIITVIKYFKQSEILKPVAE